MNNTYSTLLSLHWTFWAKSIFEKLRKVLAIKVETFRTLQLGCSRLMSLEWLQQHYSQRKLQNVNRGSSKEVHNSNQLVKLFCTRLQASFWDLNLIKKFSLVLCQKGQKSQKVAWLLHWHTGIHIEYSICVTQSWQWWNQASSRHSADTLSNVVQNRTLRSSWYTRR